jgi:hypothetical protein
MAEGKISSLPISEINSEAGAQELVRSERMKPYRNVSTSLRQVASEFSVDFPLWR